MTPYILLAVGLVCLSAVIAYAHWIKLRVWVFRQDLFEIRDDLWLTAQRDGFLDHPEYRSARESINALIRLAPLMSASLFLEMRRHIAAAGQVSPAPQLGPVRHAFALTGQRLTHYIFRQSLSGILLSMFPEKRQVKPKEMKREAEQLVESRQIIELDRECQESGNLELVAC